MHATMRPLGFGEVLDGAFTLLRRNFIVLFSIALLPQIPVILFWLLAPAMIGTGSDGSVFLAAAPLLISPYSFIAQLLIGGALTWAAASAYGGASPRTGEALGHGFRRLLPIAGVSIVAWFLIALGLLFLIIPGLILMTMFFAMYAAVIVEKRGPIEALGRSRQLSRGARMHIFGVFLVALLITYLPLIAVWTVAGVGIGVGAALSAASATGTSIWYISLMQACSLVVSAVTFPFLINVSVLLYYDRRARTEAPDLESAVAALQDNAV